MRGNRRIEEAAIRARITSAIGGTLNAARLAEDVREIYALGFFKNVRVLQDDLAGGVGITFAVEENPIVRQVSIDRQRRGRERQDPRQPDAHDRLDARLPAAQREPRSASRQLYRAEGYYLADVKFEVEQLPDDAVAVNFIVEEGEKLEAARDRVRRQQGLQRRRADGRVQDQGVALVHATVDLLRQVGPLLRAAVHAGSEVGQREVPRRTATSKPRSESRRSRPRRRA